ncbi:uncharacterized protein LOC133186048 [Saccostrea echinata]|uniref:uncharacterized protein LOC133186048 n=1 Tax=Saccostrea echinata TaxID=191078 RepID=UPI002A7F1AB5|nr:uncharacterized protein LOC133186048 [Saccostrea echinata]
MKAYHNLNRVSILTSLACIAFSVVYVLYCGRDSHNPDSCPPNEREEMISNILAMLISFIMIICSIMGIILFQINSKVLGLKNLLERVSEENRNASQEQTEYTTRSNRLEGLELQTQIITDIENRITEFENISHSQRLGPQRYNSNFLDPNAPPPYERNSSDPTEFEYRNTEFQNNSHPQRFGLPPYDNNDSDLTEISHGTTEMEINSHPQRLEPPPYDSSLPDPMSTPPPYECNPSDTTEIDYRNTGFQNNSNLQRLGLPSYDDVSDSTEIGSRTTEFENYSHHQNFATPVDYNSIDLTEPPPTYEEYMRNL